MNIEMKTSSVDEKEVLKARIESLDEQIESLWSTRRELKNTLLGLQSAFKVGDVIEWSAGRSLRKGRVKSIGEWCDRPMWNVVNVRKDGSDGDTVTVRDYQKPSICTK